MIQEHNNSTWQGKAYSKIVDTTQQVTSFPVVVRPMENAIPSWTIKGNMQQTGTPTPQNPIQPSECGERTANLFDYAKTDGIIANKYINHRGSMVTDNEYYISYPIKVNVGETYTWRFNSNEGIGHTAPTVGFYDSSDNLLSTAQHNITIRYFSFEVPANCAYIRASVFTRSNMQKEAMLNTGSTPLPYEPYGYKLTISSANTTTPVYLGEVQTTRKIKKYEITGLEDWRLSRTSPNTFWINNFESDYDSTLFGIISCKCSHYLSVANQSGLQGLNNFDVCLYCYNATASNYHELYLKDDRYSSITDFKAYLQQQYAAGTPVTVWYVLVTPTTAIVNEPIRKIGTYSDSVSGTNLSVTAQSPTTIDVDTSLKPSEMDLTYTGLKMCGRKKYASLLADNPLCGIGTYKDTLDLSNGSASRYVRKTILTGTETINTQKDYYRNNTALFVYRGYTTGYNKRDSRNSHFVSITTNPQTTSYESSGFNDASMYSDYYYMRINYNTIGITGDESYADCVNAFKTWLAQQYANGTPVTIYYYVSTPTTETITVPSGLSGTEEGYLNQSGTPTPLNPIYPTANSVPYWS